MFLGLRGASLNFLVAVCVGGPPLSLPGVWWPLAGVRRAGAASSGVCGGLVGLDPRLVALALVLWCALVRRGVLCRVSSCCLVLVPLCCSAPCSVLPCCAVSCRGVPRCAASRRVVLWCVVSWSALSWCVARRCAAVRYAVLPRVVPWWGRGVGSVVVRLSRVVVQDASGGFFGWLVAGGCG